MSEDLRAQIVLAAEYRQFAQDMSQVKGIVGDTMTHISGAADLARNALGALGIAASVGGLVSLVKDAISGAAGLHELSEQTGVSVEALSALKSVAKLSGTSMDEVRAAIVKLSKNMVDAAGGTGTAANAFAALGVSVTDGNGKMKTADQVFFEVSKSLQGFKEGAAATALKTELLGKAGANLSPVMNDLVERGNLVGKVTSAQAAAADEYEKQMIKVQGAMKGWFNGVALDLLPVLSKLGGLVESGVKVGAAYAAVFYGVPAVVGLASTAMEGFGAAVYAASMGTLSFSTALGASVAATKAAIVEFGLLKSAGALAIAAFAGWEIGSWLRENFVEARLAGVAFIDGLMTGWQYLKYGAEMMWLAVQDIAFGVFGAIGGGLATMVANAGQAMKALGMTSAGDAVSGLAERIRTATASTFDFNAESARAEGQLKTNIAFVKDITDAMADEAIEYNRAAEKVKVHKKELDFATGSTDKAAKSTKQLDDETKKLLSTWDAAEKAGEGLMRSVALKNAELEKEIELGRTLTPLEKDLAKFESDWAAEKVIMSEADKRATIEAMKHADALVQQRDRMLDAAKAMVAAQAAQDKSTDSVRQAVEKQAEANAVLGLSAAALHDHEQALIADKIATLQARAAVLALEETDLATKLSEEVEEWKKLRDLKAQAFDAKMAQDFLANAQHTFEGVAGGFADAMMGGVDSIKKYLKTQLENMLIRVPLQMVAQGLAGDATNTLASALGISQPGGAKSGLGDLLSGGKDIYNMLAGGSTGSTILGGLGGNVLGGGAGLNVGAGLGIEGVGASFGAEFGGAAFGAEALGGTAAAAGGSLIASLSAAAPYVAGALALVSLGKKLFGGGHAPHFGGYALSDAQGNVSDVTQMQGGKQDAQMQEVVGSLVQVSAGLLNSFASTFGAQGGFSVRAGAEFNGQDAGWGFLKIVQDGFEKFGFDAKGTLAAKGEEGFKQFTGMTAASLRDVLAGMDVPEWARGVLAAIGESPSMEGLVAAVQQINATKTALQGMVDAVAPLGGVFGRLSGLSGDAQMQLAKFTGGIESFLQKTASYVQNYFTDEEQAAIQAQNIMRTLTAAGLDGNALKEKGDLRRLLDSIDPNNEQGRQQIAALLNINADFAQLSKYLETSGMTLAGLANIVPGTATVLEKLTQTSATDTAATDTAAAAKDTATATKEVATASKETSTSVATIAAQNAAALPTILETLQELLARVTDIESTMEREAGKPAAA